MAELNTPLACENISSTAHIEAMARRQTDLAAMPQTTEAEKGIFRQKQKVSIFESQDFIITYNSQITTIRDMTEKVLRKVKDIAPEDCDNQSHFTSAAKSDLLQMIRALGIEEQKQASYLTVVQSDGFGVADAVFQEHASELTSEQQKALDAVRKRKRTSYPPLDTNSNHGLYQPAGQPFGGGNQAPYNPGPNWGSNYTTRPKTSLNLLGNKLPFPRRVVDKTNSICHACQMVGHWAGDTNCPASKSSYQPPPPGTG